MKLLNRLTTIEYPSAFAVYSAIKLKTKNFTGSHFSGNIKIAFVPFNSDVILSVERVNGGFGEGIIHIHTNDTTIEKVICDDSFDANSTYFYLTTSGVVVCYNADGEPYNLTVNIIHDSSNACVLEPTSTLGNLITISLTKFEGKQDALGFTPEDVANKKTSLDENSDTCYPTQKAVKTALDAKADKASQVQSDWNQSDSESLDFVKNKPTIKAGQGANSIIEGNGTTASGNNSHAEGNGTTASGWASHAEGTGTEATMAASHAEGNYATASGDSSHAEGASTTASGQASHAEGVVSDASGSGSHAEGWNTTANHKSQHVFGEWNIADPSPSAPDARGNYIEIVGNGARFNAKSNARTLDWSGNEVLAGTITANGVNLNDELNLKEPLLPVTPIQPESKFLNGNRQWVEIGGGGGLTTVYKSITIENPTASENMCIFYAPVAMTITEIRGVITGATSVSFKVVSGTSRNAVTTEHNSSAVVCSSVTTGDVATITTAAVAAGSWVAVKTSAIAGAPSELVITLSLTF
jgi:hypothetical protein